MAPLYLPFISCQLAFCPVIYLSVQLLFVIAHTTQFSSLPIFFFFLLLLYSHPTLFFLSSFVHLSNCPFAAMIFPLFRWTYCIYFLSFSFVIIDFTGFTLVTFSSLAISFSRSAARMLLHFRAHCRVIDRHRKLRAANGEIRRLRERNYDVRDDNPFSPQLLTVNF